MTEIGAFTLKAWLTQASLQLQQAGCDNSAQEARLLLTHALQVPAAHLYTWPDQVLTPEQLAPLNFTLQQRLEGQPLAWILGEWAFWGLSLQVSPATLIPRADTECLVEQALCLCTQSEARVLDLGTGTGALALALKSERPNWRVDAVDVQPSAVQLARTNARRLDLNVRIWASDWWQAIPEGRYDLVVSNPPYIHPQDPHLTQGDLRFEPASALVGGSDGLEAYRQLLAPIQQRLAPGGWLLVEQGYDQAEAVAELFRQAGLGSVEGGRDAAGQSRMTWGCQQKG